MESNSHLPGIYLNLSLRGSYGGIASEGARDPGLHGLGGNNGTYDDDDYRCQGVLWATPKSSGPLHRDILVLKTELRL